MRGRGSSCAPSYDVTKVCENAVKEVKNLVKLKYGVADDELVFKLRKIQHPVIPIVCKSIGLVIIAIICMTSLALKVEQHDKFQFSSC